jgi:hypothetical protein
LQFNGKQEKMEENRINFPRKKEKKKISKKEKKKVE